MVGVAMPDWLLIVLGGLVGNIVGIYAIIAGRKKAKAETEQIEATATQIVADTAGRQVIQLQARIDRLEAFVIRLEEKVAKLESANDELARQVRDFRDLIRSLWEGVLILSQQLNSHGIPLAWNMTQYRKLVEKALGDPEA